MSYVLAIEPGDEQAGILRTAVSPKTSATLTVVDSLGAAMAAIDEEVPHLVLVSALMSPLDEGKLAARLRDIPRDEAPQLLIIPALAAPEKEPKRRLFGRRRNRYEPARCDPSAFADHVSAYLDSVVNRRPKAIVPREPAHPVSLVVKSGADRRAAVRLEGIDWARALVDGAAVNLIDLSATGAQVLAPMILPPGGRVQVLLAKDERAIRCEAGIVWGGFEIVGPADAPWYRAGMSFRGADREAVERFYSGRG